MFHYFFPFAAVFLAVVVLAAVLAVVFEAGLPGLLAAGFSSSSEESNSTLSEGIPFAAFIISWVVRGFKYELNRPATSSALKS
ncbi:MAG: hypothetical protein IIT73_07025 [Treponema sp.]|nr:hypothetical protein [Treponema sp.]